METFRLCKLPLPSQSERLLESLPFSLAAPRGRRPPAAPPFKAQPAPVAANPRNGAVKSVCCEPVAILVDSCPCDDCPLRGICGPQELACDAFGAFLAGGPWHESQRAGATRERFVALGLAARSAPAPSAWTEEGNRNGELLAV
jgi:hypothetical protein